MSLPECPALELLIALDRGELPEPIALGAAEHLARCPPCQARLEQALQQTPLDPLRNGLRSLGSTRRTPRTMPNRLERTLPLVDSITTFVLNDAIQDATATTPIPTHPFENYRILERIGSGGMGVVYRAMEQGLNRLVALKMLPEERINHPEACARFRVEAQAAARLQHPNIAQVFAQGDIAGQPYVAFEFVTGGSLAERLQDALPEPKTAARLMIAVAKAVHEAHLNNVLHRDLKPSNILLTGDRTTPFADCQPKVIDFGVAKFLDRDESGETCANAVLGTPSYMSPEQASGKTATAEAASDIYSLGATLYDLLTGRPPFKGTNVAETLQMVVEQEPVPLRQVNPRVPRDLETICLKCLQKAPEQRYHTAAALAADLERYLHGDAIHARRVRSWEKGVRWAKRRPALAITMSVALFSLSTLAGSAVWFFYTVSDREQRHDHAVAKAIQADRDRRATEERRLTNEYHALLRQARERLASRGPEWTWHAQDDVRRAAELPTDSRNFTELRSVLAAAEAGTSWRVAKTLAAGTNTWALAFHPTQPWVAIGEGRVGNFPLPLKVLVVETGTGHVLRSFSYPVGAITDTRQDRTRTIAFSPDGRWLVAGTRKGWLHRWDLQHDQPERQSTLIEDKGEFQDLAFASDGQALFASLKLGTNGLLVRWNTRTWDAPQRRPTPNAYGGLVVRADGQALYANDAKAALREYDPADLAKDRGTFGEGECGTQALSPDGRLLASSHHGNLVLWDPQTRTKAGTLREPNREHAFPDDATVLRISPDGRLVAAVNEFTRHVYLYDLVTGEQVGDYRAEGEGIHPIAFAPDGRHLAVGGEKGTTLLELSGQEVFCKILPQPYPVRAATINEQADTIGLMTATQANGKGPATLTLWPHPTGAQPRWRRADFAAGRIATIHTQRNHFTFTGDGPVQVLHANAPEPAPTMLHYPGTETAGVNCSWLWINTQKDVYAMPLDRPAAAPLRYTNTSARLTGRGALISFAGSAHYTAIGGLDGGLRLFPAHPTTDLKPLHHAEIDRRNDLRSLAIAPDESFIVVGTESGATHIVAVPNLTVLHTWPAHGDAVSGIVFLGPQRFATGSKDRTVHVWEWHQGTLEEVWSQQLTGEITSLSASGDGRWLVVTAQGERGIRRWDVAALEKRFHQLGLKREEKPAPR